VSWTHVVRRALLLCALGLGARLGPAGISELASYPLLGVVPGLALVEWLLPALPGFVRLCLATAIAPLAAASAGLALHAAGLPLAGAATATAIAGSASWLLAGARPPRAVRPPELAVPRAAVAIAIGLAIAVALPPLLNPYIAARGDTWTHGAIVSEILERGLPPEDPRFAAIPLHYAWFYNLFIALLCSLRGQSPFPFMAWMNVATGLGTVGLAAVIAVRLWGRPAAGIGAAALMAFGLNAGAWLLWPLRLLRALTGAVRGPEELALQLRTLELGSARIIYSLSAPFAHMVSFLDKLLVGSPLAYGYLLMILHLWATLEWLGGASRAFLPWIAATAAGMLLFHGVVGLSVVPVWLGTLGLALALKQGRTWLPGAGRIAAAGAATLAGALATTPYVIGVASAWTPGPGGLPHSYLSPDPRMLWTSATACAFALWFARRPAVESWRERYPDRALLALYTGCMLLFACVIRLPMDNQVKFVFQLFTPAALLGAPAFWEWVRDLKGRGPARATLALSLLFLTPAALTLHGYLADPGPPREPSLRERRGEERLDRWIRERTPVRAIFLDHRFRWEISVKGRRQLFLGTDQRPEYAGWPSAELFERRRVMGDLFGAASDLPGDLRALERLRRPVYLVFRPEDDPETAGAWSALSRRGDRFELAYDAEGYRVLRLIGESE